MKEKIGTEIEELRALDGEDLGDTIGYFCENHYDRQSFAIACNQEFYLADLEKPVVVRQVRHIYAKKNPFSDGSGYELITSANSREGFFPCTYFEY